MASQQPAADQHPWDASVQARVVRATGIDTIEEVELTSAGQFVRRQRVVTGPNMGAVEVLDDQKRRDLLTELENELKAPPSGVDARALKVFTELLEGSLGRLT